MRNFDWELFCADRVWANHSQSLPDTYLLDDRHSTLFQEYGTLSTTFDESDFIGRYAWIEAVADPDLATKLKKLSNRDLELLTYVVIEGHSQIELSHKWSCSQKAISRHFQQIKKFLQKPV